MRKVIVVVLAIILLIPLVIVLSAQLSLDRSFAHTKASAALPVFDSATPEGQVQIPIDDMIFRARIAGMDNSGPNLILLHGFPETSVMWEPLIDRAAAQGYRVIAYDQRGFSPGARPLPVASYSSAHYTDDLLKIADAVGFDQFHLIGHDWGSLVGWKAAIDRPDRITTWASLSISHPGAWQVNSSEDLPTYVKVFQVPQLAETLFGMFGFWPMNSLLYTTMPERDKAEYNAVFREPGALTAALNLYRAIRDGPDDSFEHPVTQPVLYIYGTQDIPAYVNPQVQARMPTLVEGPYETLALDAGHWLIQEHAELVVDRLMQHLEVHRLE